MYINPHAKPVKITFTKTMLFSQAVWQVQDPYPVSLSYKKCQKSPEMTK